MRDPPFSPSAHKFATPGFPEHRRNRARPATANCTKKPRLFNKRIIFRVAEKCCRNVTAVRNDQRARRAERAGRSFIGIGVRMRLRRSEMFHRTRETVPGVFASSGQQPTLFKDLPTSDLAPIPIFSQPSPLDLKP